MENAVILQLRSLLRSPDVVAQTFLAARGMATGADGEFSERDVAAALENLDALWESLFPAEQARVLQLLVAQVVVNVDGLNVSFHLEGLQQAALEILEEHGATA